VSQLKQYSILESLSTAFLKKVKSLRLSLGRPSRSDLVQPEDNAIITLGYGDWRFETPTLQFQMNTDGKYAIIPVEERRLIS